MVVWVCWGQACMHVCVCHVLSAALYNCVCLCMCQVVQRHLRWIVAGDFFLGFALENMCLSSFANPHSSLPPPLSPFILGFFGVDMFEFVWLYGVVTSGRYM